ncbi:MAG: AraC family transcriptional regulator [Clostridia bacterium]|nr:AraC family transcriptional regulator [Clostridia bacterium]
MSFNKPLQIMVGDNCINGKCVVINKNVPHSVIGNGEAKLSVLAEPTSGFASKLISEIKGDYLICDKENIAELQQKALNLFKAKDKEPYAVFVKDLAEYLGIDRNVKVLNERIIKLLEILQNCDCYDHTIESFADKVYLSSSRLSHLFCEQTGVSLKSYILFHQLEKAFAALLNGKSVTDAAMLAGFDSPSHFAATVKKWMGMPVSQSIKDSEFLKVFT